MSRRIVRSRFGLVALCAGVALSALGATSSGAAAPLPVVKVAPATGLVDLQKVTVTGTGFSPNVQIGTVECKPGALAEPDCDLGTLVYAQSDQHGAITLERYVRRLIRVRSKRIDCAAAKGCIVGAANVANLKQANGQYIFFNPKIPPKVATIAVTPNTKLVDHQLVTVSGKGFAPGTTAYVSQCVTKSSSVPSPLCGYSTQRYVAVDADGAFSAKNFALERRQVTFTRTGVQQTIDCAAANTTCAIQVTASGIGSSNTVRVALSFDPKSPIAVAAVDLSPHTPLVDLESVTLTGSGFTPGVAVNVLQCVPTTTKFPACDYTTNRAVTAGFHGEFTLTYTPRRNLAAFVSPTGTTSTDCAAKPGACELQIQGSQSQPAQFIGLTFDPGVPGVTPTIVAQPNTGLVDNQSIGVTLGGFTPNQPVQVVECSAEAISEGGNLSYCDYTTAQLATPTGTAPAQTTFAVRAVIGGPGGLVDCTAQPGACVLVATENGGSYYGGGIVTPPFVGVAGAATATTQPKDRALPAKAALGTSLPNIAFTELSFAAP